MFSEIKSILNGEKVKPNYRGRYWLVNMLKFYPMKALTHRFRDMDLWIFGCWEGNRYDDNSRSLFEYVNRYHKKSIKAVWLAMNPEIVEMVRNQGYEAYMAESPKGKDIQKRAGVVFYTNGMDDFGYHGLFYGAVICSLWHGLGIKHHYFAGVTDKNAAYYKNKIQMKIFSWVYRDITVTSSEVSSEFFRESFCISDKTMALTGFPRNDVFKSELDKRNVMGNEKYRNAKIVLYMPTYRNYGDEAIKEVIYGLSEDKDFTDRLEVRDAYFVLKNHYLTKLDEKKIHKRIIVLDNKKVSSAQELLAVADVLVTDYSSCIFDFSVTGRPSILYASDFDTYVEKVGILDRWRSMYETYAIRDIETLKATVNDILYGKSILAEKTTKYVSREYIDSSIKDDCYSENVYGYVRRYQKLYGKKKGTKIGRI